MRTNKNAEDDDKDVGAEVSIDLCIPIAASRSEELKKDAQKRDRVSDYREPCRRQREPCPCPAQLEALCR